jgi:hypothetical protein
VAVNAEVGCILLPLPVEKPVPLLPFMLEQSLETRITSALLEVITTSTWQASTKELTS